MTTNQIAAIYDQLAAIDEHLIRRWVQVLKKRIADFAKAASASSPYLDKPSFQRDFQRGRFWIKPRKEGFIIFGISPNSARVRGFGAPVNEWAQTEKVFHIFGPQGWRTIKKAQKTEKTAGIETASAYYFGQKTEVKGYFGLARGRMTLAYGRTEEGTAMPIYAKDSFADWLMRNHRGEIDKLILEAGEELLHEHLSRGAP